MGTGLALPPQTNLTPEQADQVANGINAILVELGGRPEAMTGWWDFVRFPELDNMTVVGAWAGGKHESVRRLLVSQHERSVEGARRIAQAPEMRTLVRKRLAELD